MMVVMGVMGVRSGVQDFIVYLDRYTAAYRVAALMSVLEGKATCPYWGDFLQYW